MKTIESLDALLKEAVDLGATDLHLSVGTNPRYRLYGKIESLSYPVLDERTAESLIFPLIDTKQRVDLNDTGQIDTSYTLHGVSRFRVNIFRQKGALAAVFRALPNKEKANSSRSFCACVPAFSASPSRGSSGAKWAVYMVGCSPL